MDVRERRAGKVVVLDFGAVASREAKDLQADRWRKTKRLHTCWNEVLEAAALYDREGLQIGFTTTPGAEALDHYQLYLRRRRLLPKKEFIAYVGGLAREDFAKVSYRRASLDKGGTFIAGDKRAIARPGRIILFLYDLCEVMPIEEQGRLARAVWIEHGIAEGALKGPNPYR
jgi:hypothetical protein